MAQVAVLRNVCRRDGEIAFGVSRYEMTHRVGDFMERIGALDARGELARFD